MTTPRNPTRDHWRSVICEAARTELGYTAEAFQTALVRNPLLAADLRKLLDDLDAQETREGRSHGMQVGCMRQCTEIAIRYRHLATEAAPRWVREEVQGNNEGGLR